MTKEEMEKQIHSFAELMYKAESEDGKKDYKDGLEDGKMLIWQFVRKLGRLTIAEIYETFGDEYNNIYDITFDYSPSEFIDAIKEYEEKQKKRIENCSILNDTCPYDIPCAECEVHCSIARARNKAKELKGDKE